MVGKTAPKENKAPNRQTSRSANRKGGTIREIAEELGVGLNQAYAAAKCGEIRAIRIGRRFIVPRSERARLLGE
jgi:excisionase family DNA binding protein